MKKRIKESIPDRIFLTCMYILLTIILILVFYPLIYIVSCSFSSSQAVISGKVVLFPVEPSLLGYKAVFKHPHVVTGYANSLFYAVVGTIINLLLTVMAAYPLSRKDFYGRNIIMFLFTFTMLFSGGLIPTYLLVKNLNMLDTRWAMLIPNAMGVWYVIIARTYFQTTIPGELREAANLDGCNDIRFIIDIVIPLSTPIIAVLALFYAVMHWNSYFNALIYLTSQELFPLQIILRNILIMNEIDASMIQDVEVMLQIQGLKDLLKYSLIVVASAPVLALYPFIQKYFVKGIMLGSLKG